MKDTAILGLDIGGTKTAAGIVLFPSGAVLHRTIIPTAPHRPGAEVLEDICNLAGQLKDAAATSGHAIAGIGAGVAELVGPNGDVTSSQTIQWDGMPVRECLNKIAPAVVESDVRAAAVAEALMGAGRKFRCFVYVTVGTGISSCLVQDGKPHAGAHGNAIVLATAPLSSTCPHCGVYSSTVLEEFASGPALARRFSQKCGKTVIGGEEVTSRAEAGDELAIEVVATAGRALGVSVAFLANVLDPEAIIVGGGLGMDGRLYWRSMVESTRVHIWAEVGKSVPILPAILGKEAGLIGAAAAFWKSHRDQSASQ
jgi:glucokinase